MVNQYKDKIDSLVSNLPFDVDPNVIIKGAPPTMAHSEFLTNKEQGDWAEQIVFNAINENSTQYLAVKYGHAGSLAAGDDGFADFFIRYIKELNNIGKRPDLLIFRREDIKEVKADLDDDDFVGRAVAAIEVRSSSFLAEKYANFMEKRSAKAIAECNRLRDEIFCGQLSALLKEKAPPIYDLLKTATDDTFRELDFRRNNWSTTSDLRKLSDTLKQIKEQIKILHKRDFLSITPKLEDIALVNRWIQRFNVPHYYLQVFFDKAYVIPFKEILEISSDPAKEGTIFSIDTDSKNQGKTTIKINVQVGSAIIGKIDMPEHKSAMKELDRGRLLFYVTFNGGRGYLDNEVFQREIINDI